MSLIDRRFQLADDAGGLGLHCTPDGVTLAGTPLLRTTVAGLAPRSRQDLGALLKAAYGRDLDPDVLASGLTVVAKALDDGDLGRAMIASVRLRLPELDPAAAQRVAAADEAMSKAYSQQEPRDWHGRWTTGGVGAGAKPPKGHPPHLQRPALPAPISAAPSKQLIPVTTTRSVVLQTMAAGVPPRTAVWDAFRTLYPTFQSQFDDLDPVQFAKRVIRFAEWVETQAHDNRPFDRAGAKAEVYFLENRLAFWLGYPYKPVGAHLNLISASSLLFQAAANAGLVRQGDTDSFPKSWESTLGLAIVLDAAASGRGMPVRAVAPEAFRELDARMPWLAERTSGMSGTANNNEVGIEWDMGIDQQGRPWEKWVASQLSKKFTYMPDGKVFDVHEGPVGEAISCKTLNTMTYGYIKYPNRIYSTLSKVVKDVASYVPGVKLRSWDVPPERITSRTIHLAIPEETNPEQWVQINRAADLAKSKNIGFVVTRIRSNGT